MTQEASNDVSTLPLPSRLAALEVGESFSLVQRFTPKQNKPEARESWIGRTQRTLTSAIGRARNRLPGSAYKMNSGAFESGQFDVFSVLVVTRIA